MSKLKTEFNIDQKRPKETEVTWGSLWTDGSRVYILAVVDYEHNQSEGRALYAAVSLQKTANRFNDPTKNMEEAVEGLDPFEGTIEISQTEALE